MKYKDFKKELERKKEEENTLKELNNAISVLTYKRDNYINQAKDALKLGNTSQYNACVSLLKNAIFNLKQAQDMVANFTIARDMCEMQTLNKHFVKSLDSVMKNVYKTCKAIHVSNSEKTFMKALLLQSQTSMELQQALQNNNVTFASSVNTLSDITDEEIKDLLGEDATSILMDKDLDRIEKILGNNEKLEDDASVIKKSMEMIGGPSKPVTKSYIKEDDESTSDSIELLADEQYGGFVWDNIPSIGFADIAGLEDVKDLVKIKVLLPLKNPEAFEGYEKKNGGGLCLYGPPGTGKTMVAAAIAHEIGAKFCSVKPSDLLQSGIGNTERAVRSLFAQARKYPCAVIYFDEMDAISPKNTRSTASKQLRSEFLAQLQGVESYGKDTGNILFLICATNKPWDIDSAFLRPGRFGTKIYIGLPDDEVRKHMIEMRLEKIKNKGVVRIDNDINLDEVVTNTNGFNCSDITNLLDRIEEISIARGIETNEKYICHEDFKAALEDVNSSVQADDIEKLQEWRSENDK